MGTKNVFSRTPRWLAALLVLLFLTGVVATLIVAAVHARNKEQSFDRYMTPSYHYEDDTLPGGGQLFVCNGDPGTSANMTLSCRDGAIQKVALEPTTSVKVSVKKVDPGHFQTEDPTPDCLVYSHHARVIMGVGHLEWDSTDATGRKFRHGTGYDQPFVYMVTDTVYTYSLPAGQTMLSDQPLPQYPIVTLTVDN